MLSAKIIGRSSGGNAVAAAAYRAGERLEGERCSLDEAGKMTRSREVFDYTNKGAVVDSFIVAPQNASQALTERQTLWRGHAVLAAHTATCAGSIALPVCTPTSSPPCRPPCTGLLQRLRELAALVCRDREVGYRNRAA